MRRLAAALVLLSTLALPVVAGGCATYTQDLERAEKHYAENNFPAALALFRVLEEDIDSLTPAEQTRYAYTRGMTDFRLSSLSVSGSGVADPRKAFRMNARHWLAVAAATEKQSPGGLRPDEKTRLEETLNELNRDVYGGADVLPEATAAPAASDAPAAGSAAPGAAPAPTAP